MQVRIEKLVHGGQGIADLPDGRKVFVWNALPGELVEIELHKSKKSYAEAVALKVLEPSDERVEPKDEAYLSTSPWQIMEFAAENAHKRAILAETMQREGVEYSGDINFYSNDSPWYYRNKMEYSFYGDDDGLHLALYNRGTHHKQIVKGSSLARPEIDDTANKIVKILGGKGIRASQLKTVMVRCSQAGQTAAALFVKDRTFPDIPELEQVCQGVSVYFSTPKSPASVITEELYGYGEPVLRDRVGDIEVDYSVSSFFQVNLPVFEEALKSIRGQASSMGKIVDMYSGVGTIGLSVGATHLVEIDPKNAEMARLNADRMKTKIVQASTEKALDYISGEATVIFDPPRSGLHPKIVDHLLDVKPGKIIYLSCNPITQARDLSLLQGAYQVSLLEGYNLFPKTPHIESLAVLTPREP